ncbi:MAG: hypothetical protein AAF108_05595 [Planctomycetota bacterium]
MPVDLPDFSMLPLPYSSDPDLVDRGPANRCSGPSSVVVLNGYSIDLSAYETLPAAVRAHHLSLFADVFDEVVMGRQRREYRLPRDVVGLTGVGNMARPGTHLATGETEPVPIFLIPSFGDVAKALRTEVDAPLKDLRSEYRSSAPMLVFEEAEGSERLKLGRRPCSAFTFVSMRNRGWPIRDMPYVTGSRKKVGEVEQQLLDGWQLRAFDRRHTIIVSPTVVIVQDERRGDVPERSAWVPFADGRPLWDVFTNVYDVPPDDVEIIPWPDTPRDAEPEPDHSIVDPIVRPVGTVWSNGTVGGQARLAFRLAHLMETGGVLYVVAADGWAPFQGRYLLRERSELTEADEVRAIYVCPPALP